MTSESWSPLDWALYIQNGTGSPLRQGTAVSAQEIADLLTEVKAPLPEPRSLEKVTRTIRGLQIPREAFPASEKQLRGRRARAALATIRGLHPAGDKSLLSAAYAIIEQEIYASQRPTLASWKHFATVLAALYHNEVNQDTGWSKDGPAVRFISAVLARLGFADKHHSAVAQALSRSGIREVIANLRSQ